MLQQRAKMFENSFKNIYVYYLKVAFLYVIK